MTKEEFLAHYRTASALYPREDTDNLIRHNYDGYCLCPIELVYAHLTGNPHMPYLFSASLLGLASDDIHLIMNAADNNREEFFR